MRCWPRSGRPGIARRQRSLALDPSGDATGRAGTVACRPRSVVRGPRARRGDRCRARRHTRAAPPPCHRARSRRGCPMSPKRSSPSPASMAMTRLELILVAGRLAVVRGDGRAGARAVAQRVLGSSAPTSTAGWPRSSSRGGLSTSSATAKRRGPRGPVKLRDAAAAGRTQAQLRAVVQLGKVELFAGEPPAAPPRGRRSGPRRRVARRAGLGRGEPWHRPGHPRRPGGGDCSVRRGDRAMPAVAARPARLSSWPRAHDQQLS